MGTDAAQDAAGAPAKSPQSTIGVFSVDDHPALREGIAAIVNHQPGMKLIGGASNAREGIEMFRDLRPDVTLMDRRGTDPMIIRCALLDTTATPSRHPQLAFKLTW